MAARPRRAAHSLAALSALAFFVCLISIGSPPGGSALPLERATPARGGTLTLTLEGRWQAPPAAGEEEDTWAASVAWGWFFLARLARRRRARAAARPGTTEGVSSGGDPSSGRTPEPALARPAGFPWAGSLGPSSSGGPLALGWADPACPSPPLEDDPLPWAYSGGLCLAGPGEACEASLAEGLPWAAELLEPLPSLGALSWLMEGPGPTTSIRMEDGPSALACSRPRAASAALPRPPSWQDWEDPPPEPGVAGGDSGGTPWAPPPASPTCSPGGNSSSSHLEALLLPPAGTPSATPTSSGCQPSSRSCGLKARGGSAAAAPAAAPPPSPAAAPAVQASLGPAAHAAAAMPPRSSLAARLAAPRPAATTSGSCSPRASPGFTPLGFAPTGLRPGVRARGLLRWGGRARGRGRTPLADALAPLGAALLAAQAFAELRLGSPLAPSKVLVTEG